MNFISILFSVFSIGIGLGGLFQIVQPRTPQIFQDLFLYGKIKDKAKGRNGNRETFIKIIEVPKRWFLHMYIAGVVVNGVLLSALISTFVGYPIFDWLQILPRKRIISLDYTTALLMLICIFIQVSRRTIECLFLHVFSKSGTMNVIHYLLGITLYTLLGVSVLVETPVPKAFPEFRINIYHVVGVSMFLWSSWQHYSAHSILASLRINPKGKILTEKHLMPRGGWFDRVSCPHYLMEILTYISFGVIQSFANHTFCSIILFVVVNQVVASYITHMWYLKTFPGYPKQRKAVFPLIL
ncbi:polyprenal reductase-like [Tubulanus polymorphus]|uniref:polyprenal reductase-like n=1 Tax=Tubulanus polymorphus TaxID=672921 RepID=UPI003DA57647